VFPDVLKISRVIPVYKKGDPKLMENYYLAISILSVLSKIIETIVKTRLVDFVDRHAIFYARQYGFRHNSNTEAALFDFVAHTQQLVERKWKVGMIFYDLSKAFDTVNNEKLLEKLAAIGILGDDTGSKVTSQIVRNTPM
jgi:hypothetical protein